MSKALSQFRQQLQSGHIAPVYIAVGDELHSKEKFFKLLRQNLLDPSMAAFNFEQLDAAAADGFAVADKAAVLPMMAERRLVLVTGCDAWKKKSLDTVLAYLREPNESTTLVLDFNQADRRKKFFQFRSPKVQLFEFKRPRSWELEGFISGLAAEMKLRVSREAVALIAEMAGDDIARVYRELEKLSLFKLGSPNIEVDDVAALMGRTRQVTRWELNDYIGKRDLAGALMKVHQILGSGEEPISLLSAISMCVRQLFLTKTLVAKGVRDNAGVGKVLGLPPKIAGGLIQQQAQYSNYELRRAFRLMSEADFKLKSAGMNRGLIIDHLITQVLSRGELSPPKSRRGVSRRR